MTTLAGGGVRPSSPRATGSGSRRARWWSVVHEFWIALRRPHTFRPLENPYFLFGLGWGVCLPVALVAFHLWEEAHPFYPHLSLADLFRADVALLMLVPPTLLGVVFGALGTVRHDKHELTSRTIRVLDHEVSARSSELAEAYTQTVLALSQAIEAKDPYTRGHCFRVWEFAERAATQLGLATGQLRTLEHACFLHDVGKIHIPGRILNKAGPLTVEELELVKLHPVYSARIVAPIAHFKEVAHLVRHHHERSDGSGYPDGLTEDGLTLSLRVLIVADAMDAMTSDRPYRQGLPLEVALEELRRCSGLPFDPALVPRAKEPCRQFDPAVVTALIDALRARPVAGAPVPVPTREDAQIAAYVARTSGSERPSPPPAFERSYRKNCWEVVGCGRGPGGARVAELGRCPASGARSASGLNGGHNGGRICWAVAAVDCTACAEKGGGEGPRHCADCHFFHQVKREEGLVDFQLLTPSLRGD